MGKVIHRYTYGGYKFEWDGEIVMVRLLNTNQTHSLFFLERDELLKDNGTLDLKRWRAITKSWALLHKRRV